MSTPEQKQFVVDELQKTIQWLVDQQADSKLVAAVVHTLQLTLDRFVAEESADQFYESLRQGLGNIRKS